MEQKKPLLSRTLIILLISMVAANIGTVMYMPLLPLYVQQLGASIEQIGIFFTIGMVLPLLFQIFGGWFSDASGRVRSIAIGSLVGMVGYLAFIVAPSWHWLLLGVLGGSMAGSFVGPSFQALVAEETAEADRGKAFGLTNSVFLIVGVVGAPLGGFLSDRVGFRWMFIVAAGLYAIATLIRLLMLRKISREETTPRAKPTLGGLKTSLLAIAGLIIGGGVFTWLFISDGVGDFTSNIISNLFPLYFNNIIGLTKTQLGFLGAAQATAMVLLTTFGGMISDRAGERIGIVLGSLLSAMAIFIMLNVTAYPLFIIAFALMGIGAALAGPAYNSLTSKVIPNHLRGTAFGLLSTSLGVISLPAPYIGTWMWQKFGPKVPFYVPLVAMLVMLPVVWIKFKLPKSSQAPAQLKEEVAN